MPEERYVARRVDGAWCVIDRADESVVSQHSAGSDGAAAAKKRADVLNTRASSRGAEVLQWRRAHNLTQAELARHLGVQPLAIIRWETGARAIPPLLERALRDLDRELAS